ncbi:MAG: tetratricopeptide repeat protein [Bryobacteraceae bacterium]
MPSRFAVLLFLLSLSSTPAFSQRNLYKEASESYKLKQYDKALSLTEEALQSEGDNPAYLHLYGVILATLGRPGPAEENFRKAVALAPDQPFFAYELGALLHNQRKYAEAVPVLARAVELAPENLSARMMLARSYVFSFNVLKLPNFVELTLEQLNYIVKKNPQFPAVHHHLALVYVNTGDFTKAAEELNTELRLFPENAQARLELGETLLKLNENQKAAGELQIAAKQAPKVPAIQYALGKAYKANGSTPKALEAVQRCVELDPQFANCHYLLGQLYRESDQPEKAKEQFELFKQLKPAGAPND